MKLFSTLLTVLFLSAGLTNAGDLQPKITPEELGYTGRAFITYFEQIDGENLGLTVEYEKDGYSVSADWVYNLKTKEAKNITYTDDQGRDFWIYIFEDYVKSQDEFRYFLKDGSWIYTIIRGNDDIEGNYLLATHLKTGEQNIRLINSMCSGAMYLIQSAEKKFIIEAEGCGEAFKLWEFDDSTLTKVWSVQDFGWNSFSNYETQKPFYHKGKIYLSAQDKLYVFNTSDYKVDIIIEDTRDAGGVVEGCISVPTQYFAHGDNVYIVYSDVKLFVWYVINIITNLEGYTRIWKTDGTKNGTSLIKKFPKTEESYGVLTNSKLFSLDNRLLWLGDIDTTAQSEIYEIKGNDFESLGTIKYANDTIAGIIYNIPLRYSMPLSNSIAPVQFEHQDVLAYIEVINNSNSSVDMSYYLNVIGLEGNQVKKYLENYPLNSVDDPWSWSEYRCWNIGEKFTVFRHGERGNGDLGYTTYLDFLVSDSYKDIDFETYSPLEEGAWGLLSIINVGNEVLFSASDKEGKSFIIWSWDGAKVTSVRNQLSDKQLDWTIYPNPVSQFITVQSAEYLSGYLMITGVDGRIYQTLKIDGHQKQIDVSKLPNGMYVAVYKGDLHIDSQRFIIQR